MSEELSFEEELLQEFLVIAEEHIQAIEEGLVLLEKEKDNLELVNEIFRAIHSLKGDSGSVGLNKIKRISHKMESVFSLIRSNELAITTSILDLLFKSLKVLKTYYDESTGKIEPIEENQAILDELEKVKSLSGTTPVESELPKKNILLDFEEKDETKISKENEEEAEDLTDDNRYLIFELYSMLFGVKLEKTRELLPNINITPVPFIANYIAGLINFRGRIIPVLDLAHRLSISNNKSYDKSILLVTKNEEDIGLLVDNVLNIENIGEDSINSLDDINLHSDYSMGVFRKNGKLVILLNLDNVLNRDVY
ncbi:MAG: chemotaxis protein CheW [Leptospiraceae bacterium]|nr:chemotaxis protein CheW [Leptospiraceae bacterium]MCP5492992.1 chemotaxis protein CheW [Leptospiraceae bacterium]